jgi:hypothetical protein
MAAPLSAIVGGEGTVAPAPKTALADFLAMERLGSPIEARELGRPVNGPPAPIRSPARIAATSKTRTRKLVEVV